MRRGRRATAASRSFACYTRSFKHCPILGKVCKARLSPCHVRMVDAIRCLPWAFLLFELRKHHQISTKKRMKKTISGVRSGEASTRPGQGGRRQSRCRLRRRDPWGCSVRCGLRLRSQARWWSWRRCRYYLLRSVSDGRRERRGSSWSQVVRLLGVCTQRWGCTVYRGLTSR